MIRDFFSKREDKRVLPGHSTRELTDVAKKARSELRAAMYLYNDSVFIVSAIAGNTEYGEPEILDVDVSDEALGEAVCDQLLQFRVNELADPPSHLLQDWAVFRVSGARSGRAFNEASFYGFVQTINTSIRVDVSPRQSNHPELAVSAYFPNGWSHQAMGASIRRAFDGVRTLRAAREI